MTIQDRLQKVIDDLYSGSKADFAKAIGVAPSVVQNIVGTRGGKPSCRVLELACANAHLSADWLLLGLGEMIRDDSLKLSVGECTLSVGEACATYSVATPTIVSADVAGSSEDLVPVIPRCICEEPGVDVYRYIQANDVAMSPRVPQFPTCSAYYMVYGDEMLPHFMPGDKLAVSPYAVGKERKLLDGRSYLVDTVDNGLLLRTLYKGDGGFRAVAANSVYSEEFLEAGDIYRIFRILGLIRTNV